MKNIINIAYDEGTNGDYMGEAHRIAEELEREGHKDVTVMDRGNGAVVEYDEGE